MGQIEHFARPLCAERRKHQSRTAPQIARRERRPMQSGNTAHERGSPLDFDVRAHFVELRHEFKARLKEIFHDERTAYTAAVERSRLRLQIGRKSGEGHRLNPAVAFQSSTAFDSYFTIFRMDFATVFT